MGREVDKCFITDAPVRNKGGGKDAIEYSTEYNGVAYFCEFNSNHSNSEKVEKNKYILKGLIINGIFPFHEESVHYSNKKLEKIIDEAIIPTTPKEKLDELLLFIHSLQEYEGSSIDLRKRVDHDFLLNRLYFKNQKEYYFYLSTLKEYGFITFIDISSLNGPDGTDIKITYKGLEYVIGLQEEGAKSNNCFIAMWFDDSQKNKRDAIKQTISKCGYKPLIIDEIHVDSDLTINDAIIGKIRSSKFLVADFTKQRHGVYFEAGFALGMGKQVIYMCEKEDFEDSHFDTNHYSHIVYEELTQLRTMLEDKIQAWIV
ncbi:MAG: hypothetical protein KAS82_06055 [Bacteroidales bacterium]|nr:hypothetical protein [Bacteroidales bacterium]